MARIPLYNQGEAPQAPGVPDTGRSAAGRVARVDLSPLAINRAGNMPGLPGGIAGDVAQAGGAIARGMEAVSRAATEVSFQMAQARDAQTINEQMLRMEEQLGAFEQWKMTDGISAPDEWRGHWQTMAREVTQDARNIEMSPAARRELDARQSRFAARAGVRIGEDAVRRQLMLTDQSYQAVSDNASAAGDADAAENAERERGQTLGLPAPVVERNVRVAREKADESRKSNDVEQMERDAVVAPDELLEELESNWSGLVGEYGAGNLLRLRRTAESEVAKKQSLAFDGIVQKLLTNYDEAGTPLPGASFSSPDVLEMVMEEAGLPEKVRRDLRAIQAAEASPPKDRPEDFGYLYGEIAKLVTVDGGAMPKTPESFAAVSSLHRQITERISPGGPRETLYKMLAGKWHGPPDGENRHVTEARDYAESVLLEVALTHPDFRGTKPEDYKEFWAGKATEKANFQRANAAFWKAERALEDWLDSYMVANEGRPPDPQGDEYRTAAQRIISDAFGSGVITVPAPARAEPWLFPEAPGGEGEGFTQEQIDEAARQVDRIRERFDH